MYAEKLNWLPDVLNAYNIDEASCTLTPFGNGLINHTWKISAKQTYILQQVNDAVFKNPDAIAENIRLVGTYLSRHHPDYYVVQPLKSRMGTELIFIKNVGYFRLWPFVPQSHSIDVVRSPRQAFEAAKQFGKFTRLLAPFDLSKLQFPLPDFHNLTLRYNQFVQALTEGDQNRIKKAAAAIEILQQHQSLVSQYEDLKKSPDFVLRVTHHDTKICNVLFDAADNGICVIDLDTVMPGYFISDAGDMMRTYLSPLSEEENEFSRIKVRDDFFIAIVTGYLSEMQQELTEKEKAHFVYAGQFMVYMQALRFLTDYLNNDVYYGCAYEDQNFIRAGNQITLLQQLCENETHLQQLVTQAAAFPQRIL